METASNASEAPWPFRVFELPMRDGNKRASGSEAAGNLVFELPMRDGNHPNGYDRKRDY